MASEKWNDNHVKVSVYLDSDFHERLVKWQKNRGYKSTSNAISMVLKQEVDGDLPSNAVPDTILKRLEKVEINQEIIHTLIGRLAEAEAQIDLMRSELLKSGMEALDYTKHNIPINPIVLHYTPEEKKTGITKTELCTRIGLSVSTINRYSEILKIEPDAYLFFRTKWAKGGEGSRDKYFPPQPEPPKLETVKSPSSDTIPSDKKKEAK